MACVDENIKQESLIRLHTERIKMWQASINSHKKYTSSDGFFDNYYLEFRDCPICGQGGTTRFLFSKNGGRYVRCNECSLVYLNPVFKDNFLHEYYVENHSFQASTVAGDLEFYSGLYKAGLAEVQSAANQTGKILDVGCSSGVFLDCARASGWKTHGIEINIAEAEMAKEKGAQYF
jgi:2-polyprenyl-3-methyl-5-hydroxy-6-metoxy-1,4-benzoquinol methylase